jgi:ATP-binding cassette subfamily C (CFTR/MRP) protein 4
MMLGVIVVIAVVNYWMVIPTVVMLILFYMLRIYYIATSRSIKRLEGISKLMFYISLASVVQLIFSCNKLRIACIAYHFYHICSLRDGKVMIGN